MLKTVLRNEMNRRGLSSHDVADGVGVAHTTILRALRGVNVDIDTLVKIAGFLNVRPSELLDTIPNEAMLADQIAVLLSHSPELENQLRVAVKRVKDGNMDVETLRDVVGYAIYKFQQAGDVRNVRDSRSVDAPHKRRQKKGNRTRTSAR